MRKDSYHVLVRTSFVVKMSRAELIPEGAKIWDITDRIQQIIRDVLTEHGLANECLNSSIGSIDGSAEPRNASRCVVCEVWVSAQNRPEIIQELAAGAEYEGAYYCVDHLPKNSEWLKSLPWW